MRGTRTPAEIIRKIELLRSRGHSISEISSVVQKSKSIVSKYVQGVKVKRKYEDILRAKQGGSKYRSTKQWEEKRIESEVLVQDLTPRERLLILAALYWGEGTKKELNITNSDPSMLRVVVSCLKDLGINDHDFRITLRTYGDLDKESAISFWTKALNLPAGSFINVNVMTGKKEGKLPYGMCRIRVRKGGSHFKLIMSVIERIRLLLP